MYNKFTVYETDIEQYGHRDAFTKTWSKKGLFGTFFRNIQTSIWINIRAVRVSKNYIPIEGRVREDMVKKGCFCDIFS